MSQFSTGASKEEKREGTAAGRPVFFDPDAVMSLTQWYARNGISKATGQRIIARGEGPDIVELSPGRKGVTYGADADWKRRRTVSPTT